MPDVDTLIGLGILAVTGWLARGQFVIREDVREIKTTLGINGHPAQGLVPRVAELGERSHEHANKITTLWAEREMAHRQQGP